MTAKDPEKKSPGARKFLLDFYFIFCYNIYIKER